MRQDESLTRPARVGAPEADSTVCRERRGAHTDEELAKLDETACLRARLGNCTLKRGDLPSRDREGNATRFSHKNVVNGNWTLYDIRIRFSELIQVADDERPTWENQHGILLERVAVTMSWHQAKHLRDLLGASSRTTRN